MRQQLFVPVIILLAVLTAATGALAQQRNDGPRRRGGNMMKDLNLTEAQRRQIKALRRQQRTQMMPLRAQMNLVRAQLKVLWMADTLDVAAIRAKHAVMARLRGQLETLRFDFRLAVAGLLTREQRIKFASRMGRRGKRGRGHKRGGMRRGGKRHDGGMRGGGNYRGGVSDVPLEGAR